MQFEWMMMKVLTVKEAVDRVKSGKTLKGIVLNKASMAQVNVQDAMILSRGGIVVPEENLYYDDNDIEYDEEIDELIIGDEITGLSWEEKSRRLKEFDLQRRKVNIDIVAEESEIGDWVEVNKNKLGELLTPIVINLFNAEKLIKHNSSNPQ